MAAAESAHAQQRPPTPLRGFEADGAGEAGEAPPPPLRTARAQEVVATMSPPFGLRLNGDAASGVVVRLLAEGGNAQATGLIQVGFRITAIDGTSVIGKDKAAVVELLKAAAGPTDLTFLAEAPAAAPPRAATSVISVSVSPPFGLKLHGDAARGIYVGAVSPGSNAAEAGLIHTGHRVVAIDGTDVTGLDKPGVVRLLRAADGPTALSFEADAEGYRRKFPPAPAAAAGAGARQQQQQQQQQQRASRPLKNRAEEIASADGRVAGYEAEAQLQEKQEQPHHSVLQLLFGSQEVLANPGAARLRVLLLGLIFVCE